MRREDSDSCSRTLGTDPGPAPRSAGLRRVFALAPLPLKLGLVFTPIAGALSLVWAVLSPSRDAFVALANMPVPLLLATVWALRIRGLAVRGVPTEGRVLGVKRAAELPGGVEVRYEYELAGERHAGAVTYEDLDLGVARACVRIHLVVDPRRPQRSLPWGVG